jgi:hypothetical protein
LFQRSGYDSFGVSVSAMFDLDLKIGAKILAGFLQILAARFGVFTND